MESAGDNELDTKQAILPVNCPTLQFYSIPGSSRIEIISSVARIGKVSGRSVWMALGQDGASVHLWSSD